MHRARFARDPTAVSLLPPLRQGLDQDDSQGEGLQGADSLAPALGLTVNAVSLALARVLNRLGPDLAGLLD